jgi:hypothetical protein
MQFNESWCAHRVGAKDTPHDDDYVLLRFVTLFSLWNSRQKCRLQHQQAQRHIQSARREQQHEAV